MKVTKKTIFEVNFKELNNFIEDHYGQEFNIAADHECRNDIALTFHVDGVVADYESDRIEKFKTAGHYSYITGSLMNDLAAKGLIEKGDYVVIISW